MRYIGRAVPFRLKCSTRASWAGQAFPCEFCRAGAFTTRPRARSALRLDSNANLIVRSQVVPFHSKRFDGRESRSRMSCVSSPQRRDFSLFRSLLPRFSTACLQAVEKNDLQASENSRQVVLNAAIQNHSQNRRLLLADTVQYAIDRRRE